MTMRRQHTIHTIIARYRLNLPFSERRLVLLLGDIVIGLCATGFGVWLSALFH